jgi:hypothetical protein
MSIEKIKNATDGQGNNPENESYENGPFEIATGRMPPAPRGKKRRNDTENPVTNYPNESPGPSVRGSLFSELHA